MLEFVAVDVETANPDRSSICQIGIAHFRDGEVISEWTSYIDPEVHFDDHQTAVHGIDESTVRGAPTLPGVADHLCDAISNKVVVCHTAFDRTAIRRAFDKYELRQPECTWLDTARVARRAWTECSQSGYGLADVCAMLGYNFQHHDALEDAKAAGQVLVAAMAQSGLGVDGWLKRVKGRVDGDTAGYQPKVRLDGNPDGALYGEVLVFTGTLKMSRREAAELAAQAGCEVGVNVTRKTTILVLGDRDIELLAGHEKSSKHRKAEELIAKGQEIQILGEADFRALVGVSEPAVTKRPAKSGSIHETTSKVCGVSHLNHNVARENISYRDSHVTVTDKSVTIDGKTYTHGRVRSVTVATETQNTMLPLILLAGGIILALAGFISLLSPGASPGLQVCCGIMGVILALVGGVMLYRARSTYCARLVLTSGDVVSLSSPDEEYIVKITNEIRKAWMARD